MSCEWREKVALFADDELQPATQEEVSAHLNGCAECTAAVAEQLALKKAVRVAANRYSAPPDLHAAVYRQLHPHARVSPWWKWGMSAACLLLVVALGLALWPRSRGTPLVSELVDQHVIALSSPNPVDVVSEDRHTVKPWFQGRLPFTFNLPELAGSNYKLIGGKAVYIEQHPGAELLYTAGQHKISVFIFQERGTSRLPAGTSTFTVRSWTENGLQFFLVTDASDAESGRLVTMFQEANRS
jgi:anti-sigma factor RsiW